MRSVHFKSALLPLVSVLLLAGCLDDDGGDSGDGSRTGQIMPAGIAGLSYSTASRNDTTDSEGRYRYFPGETLTLKVGNLQLAEGVPVQPVVTPLEFFPDLRTALQIAGTTDEGLQSHRITEQQLLLDVPLINLTRFLLALNWKLNISSGEGIEIRERVITQLNVALAELDEPIDFHVPQDEFESAGNDPSPANQVLSRICFFPEGNELCEAPPTDEEIAAAPERPEDTDEREEDVEYRVDLENKRDRIMNAVRSLEDADVDDARNYLTRELDTITTQLANRYYLDDDVVEFPATDTAIKTVKVKKIGGKPELADIEAVSTRSQDVVVHSFGWQSASVDYFVAGESGGESELLVNFRPDDTYRWVKKQLRVIIE
ncbi:organic solvent ABC transporter permease [Marinobacter sp. SS13-12]|uniref:organic solvent ABC transporter permease n=1 Tax=Marinobacter sp. SS13-12 TaxID=3050451 RepID=UPI002556CB46|nr:organic solvent ABC transporter permease [Marinobacter sp. SS13-12]MDK8465273.1 organic solvent ABC transporter permease [Marinobacter sp. SS13-12]